MHWAPYKSIKIIQITVALWDRAVRNHSSGRHFLKYNRAIFVWESTKTPTCWGSVCTQIPSNARKRHVLLLYQTSQPDSTLHPTEDGDEREKHLHAMYRENQIHICRSILRAKSTAMRYFAFGSRTILHTCTPSSTIAHLLTWPPLNRSFNLD